MTDDAGHCSECGGALDYGLCTCDPCEIGICDHKAHCDGCGRGMPGLSESGFCFVCEAQWLASHQLTFPVNGSTGGGGAVQRNGEELIASEPNRNPGQHGLLRDSQVRILPARTLQQQSTEEIIGIVGFFKQLNRRFGINE